MTDEPRQLLIVEDDESFSRTLRRSFERRGYQVVSAHSHDQMVELLKTHHPDYAVVDLKLGTASGLTCVQTLHAFDPDLVIVVLTGFASIATAVEAIKLGARHYLAKPAGTDDEYPRRLQTRLSRSSDLTQDEVAGVAFDLFVRKHGDLRPRASPAGRR